MVIEGLAREASVAQRVHSLDCQNLPGAGLGGKPVTRKKSHSGSALNKCLRRWRNGLVWKDNLVQSKVRGESEQEKRSPYLAVAY